MTDFNKILEKAKEIEKKMKESQENLKKIEVNGVSGGDVVKITLNGDGEMTKILLSDKVLKEDKEIIQDLITAAHNDAKIKLEEYTSEQMKKITFEINKYLCKIFDDAGLILVDYKVEYGRYDGKLILGDEFTPDGCRIWDKETGESLDKDRFRKDLGDVVESYQIVAHKLGVKV